MGSTDPAVHRFRNVAGLPSAAAQQDRARARMPSWSEERAIFARDGYRCRYLRMPCCSVRCASHLQRGHSRRDFLAPIRQGQARSFLRSDRGGRYLPSS
jgi:hypothetical protein